MTIGVDALLAEADAGHPSAENRDKCLTCRLAAALRQEREDRGHWQQRAEQAEAEVARLKDGYERGYAKGRDEAIAMYEGGP